MLLTNCWPFFIAALSAVDAPPLPPGRLAITNAAPAPLYFAATSLGDTNNATCPYSNEVMWTNGIDRPLLFTWTNAVSTNVAITNYMLFWGKAPCTYVRSCLMGTNQSYTLWLVRTNTNLVVTVSWPGFSLSLTNPVDGPRYWTNAKARITSRCQ